MAINPRRAVSVKVDTLSYEVDGLVSDFIVRCQGYIDKYGPDVRFDWEQNSHDEHYSVVVVYTRLENDFEYERRLEKETKDKLTSEARERQEYERLQAKFGKK
jgi:hypothetical protein